MERCQPVTYYQLEDSASEVANMQDCDHMEGCMMEQDMNSCGDGSDVDEDDVSDTDLRVVSSTTTPTMTSSLSSNCGLGRSVPLGARVKLRCLYCCQRCTKALQSRPCTICLLIFLALLSLTCALALVSVILLMAVPYHRSSAFLQTLCHVDVARVQPQPAQCTCGTGCTVDFPCLHVLVSYSPAATDTQNPNVTYNAEMFENEAILNKQVKHKGYGMFIWP